MVSPRLSGRTFTKKVTRQFILEFSLVGCARVSVKVLTRSAQGVRITKITEMTEMTRQFVCEALVCTGCAYDKNDEYDKMTGCFGRDSFVAW